MTQRQRVMEVEYLVRKARDERDYLASCSWSEVARSEYLTADATCSQLENLLCDERGKLIRENAWV